MKYYKYNKDEMIVEIPDDFNGITVKNNPSHYWNINNEDYIITQKPDFKIISRYSEGTEWCGFIEEILISIEDGSFWFRIKPNDPYNINYYIRTWKKLMGNLCLNVLKSGTNI